MNNAEQQIQTALQDVDGALRYVVNGENEHPNRIDIINAKGASPVPTGLMGQAQQPSLSFGQTFSTAPGFGQPSGPSAFGRPSAPSLGQASAPSFGQPSVLGQSAILGRPTTNVGQTSSVLGISSAPAPVFGQASGPSPFGVPQQTPSPFGLQPGSSAVTQSTATSNQPGNPFGQASAPAQGNVFGRPLAPNFANPFGQPSASTTTNTMAPSGPFAQPTSQPSQGIFRQPPAATAIPNNQSSKTRISYANRAVPSFGFSLEALMTPQNPSDIANIPTAQAPQSFNPTTSNSLAPRRPSAQFPGGSSTTDPSARITNWKGKAVSYIDDEPCYKENNGGWRRIWFPQGPPVFTKTPGLPDEAYSTSTKDEYMFAQAHGSFQNGVMPELPPKKEWCQWDF